MGTPEVTIHLQEQRCCCTWPQKLPPQEVIVMLSQKFAIVKRKAKTNVHEFGKAMTQVLILAPPLNKPSEAKLFMQQRVCKTNVLTAHFQHLG